MAYNVLKGKVQFINSDSGSIESMVDDHSNQTIAGIKTFSGVLTASLGVSSSAYYGNGSGLSGLDVAVTTFDNATLNTIIVAKADNNISGAVGLTYNGAIMAVTGNVSASVNISGSGFYGSAVGLTSIPTNQFNGNISAASLSLGQSTLNDSGNLVVKLSSSSGLESTTDGLKVNPSVAVQKTSPADADKFLISDSAAGNITKYLTYQNLAAGVVGGITTYPPAGNNGNVQIKNGSAFQGVSQLSFDTTANTLTVTGQITASALVSSSFYGDGNNLTNLPAAELSGNVNAGNINIGNGLFNNSNTLAVSASYGLTASAQGLEVTSSAISGLNVLVSEGLVVSPIRANTTGSVADGDLFLITDVSDSNQTKNATMTTLAAYMQDELTFTPAGGSNTQVQYNNSGQFAGSSTFTFNSATNTLTFQTGSVTGDFDIQGKVTVTGSTTTATRILNISSSNTDCSIGDGNEVLTMTNTSPAKVSLPTVGANNTGTTYTIKRVMSANVEVSGAVGQTIDGDNEVRTLTSKGEYIKLVATPLGPGYGWIIVGQSGSF
jgi:hypothetical protein